MAASLNRLFCGNLYSFFAVIEQFGDRFLGVLGFWATR
jgi:hypothetical protein